MKWIEKYKICKNIAYGIYLFLKARGGPISFLYVWLIWKYFLLLNRCFLRNEDILHCENISKIWPPLTNLFLWRLWRAKSTMNESKLTISWTKVPENVALDLREHLQAACYKLPYPNPHSQQQFYWRFQSYFVQMFLPQCQLLADSKNEDKRFTGTISKTNLK